MPPLPQRLRFFIVLLYYAVDSLWGQVLSCWKGNFCPECTLLQKEFAKLPFPHKLRLKNHHSQEGFRLFIEIMVGEKLVKL